MSYSIDQVITPYAYFGNSVWQEDCTLEQPKLIGPKNSERICGSTGTIGVNKVGVVAEWEPVVGASFYVLQTSINSSFFGPDFKSYRITSPNTKYEFSFGDIRVSETIYWRVWAYSSSGCTSIKSEAWSFTWECESQDNSKNGGQNPGGEPPDINFCEVYKVQLKIEGPESMFCCDQDDWWAKMAYSCKDAFGNEQIALVNTIWELIKEQDSGGILIEVPNYDRFTLIASCHVTQKATLNFTAQFREIATNRLFNCRTHKEIKVNCETKPKDKPWLQADDQYSDLVRVINPAYVDSPTGVSDHFLNPILWSLDHTLRPINSDDENKKKVLGIAPVFEVGSEHHMSEKAIASRTSTSACCKNRFQPDYVYHQVLEARFGIPLGCGLKRDTDVLAIDLEEIAGEGLVADLVNCKLNAYGGGGSYIIGYVKHGISTTQEFIANGGAGKINIAKGTGTPPPYNFVASSPDNLVAVTNPFMQRIWKDVLVVAKLNTFTDTFGQTVSEYQIIQAYSADTLRVVLSQDVTPGLLEIFIEGLLPESGMDGLGPEIVNTIRNDMGLWGAEGDEAVLKWNDSRLEWDLIAIESQSVAIYTGYLSGDLHDPSEDPTVAPQAALNTTYNMTNLGTVTAINHIGAVGDNGTPVICAWFPATNVHWLLNIKHTFMEPLFDLYLNATTNKIVGKTKKISVMTYDQAFDEVDLIDLTEDCEP